MGIGKEARVSIYLSPTNKIDQRYEDAFGFFVSPRKRGVMAEIKDGATFAIDNDCFNFWDAEAYIVTLTAYYQWRENCFFVALPDVVGDYKATLKKFAQWLPVLRIYDYPVALVTQDGLTPDNVPWAEIDALFIGGSDSHKRGREGGLLIAAGKDYNKWVHVGRVNGATSIENDFWMADSWDGTTISREPGPKSRNIGAAVRRVRDKKQNQMSLFGA